MAQVLSRVIRGDCLQVMRQLGANSFDAIVTDPPYSSGGFTETQKRHAKGQGLRNPVRWFVADNMTTAGMVWLLREVAVEAHRLLKDGGSLCVFCDWRMYPHLAPALESSGLRLQNMLVWDKCNPGMGRGFRPQHELIIHLVKGVGRFYSNDTGNVLKGARVPSAKRLHPTEKPVDLLRAILRVVAPKGGMILDPFVGSGATLEAASLEGMHAIGIDIDSEFCEIAQKRVAGFQ